MWRSCASCSMMARNLPWDQLRTTNSILSSSRVAVGLRSTANSGQFETAMPTTSMPNFPASHGGAPGTTSINYFQREDAKSRAARWEMDGKLVWGQLRETNAMLSSRRVGVGLRSTANSGQFETAMPTTSMPNFPASHGGSRATTSMNYFQREDSTSRVHWWEPKALVPLFWRLSFL